MNAVEKKISDIEDTMNDIRVEIINLASDKDAIPISSDEYNEELTKAFRNGETSPIPLTYTRNDVSISYSHVETHKKTMSALENKRKATDNAYKMLIRQIEAMEKAFGTSKDVTSLVDGLSVDLTTPEAAGPLLSKLGMYYKGTLQLIGDTCSAHAMAYAAKLEAIKECYKQDLFNLYTAIDALLADPSTRLTKG
jgi:hypothetical protein